MARRDGRTLSPDILCIIRRKAVEAVTSGELTQQRAAEVFGVTRVTVARWVRAFRQEGEAALTLRRRGRPHGALIGQERAAALLQLLARGLPERSDIAFPLWHRESVGLLIERLYGLALSRWTLQRLFHPWGLRLPPGGRRFFAGLSAVTEDCPGDGTAEARPQGARMTAWYVCRIVPPPDQGALSLMTAFSRRGEAFFCGDACLPAAVPSLFLLLERLQALSRSRAFCQLACDAGLATEEYQMMRRWLAQHWPHSHFCSLS